MPDFAHPWFLLLLLLLPLFWITARRTRASRTVTLTLPATSSSSTLPVSGRVKWQFIPDLLRIMALAVLIMALARPQKPIGSTPLSIEGVDIMLSMDVSGSMLAQDFHPDRLSVAIEEARRFIEKRPNDRIGLVIFSGESFTQCPLTMDHAVLKNLLDNIQIEMLNSGTAIGMGLATAVNRLRTSEAKSKVVILLTDGVNNSGYIDPITAMEMAVAEGVRVYTIGVGSEGKAPMPSRDPFTGQIILTQQDVQIDEPLMKQIAEGTGGKYFRARNKQELQNIYAEIDQLEKTKMKVSAYTPKKELFLPLLLTGWILLLLERGWRTVYLKQTF